MPRDTVALLDETPNEVVLPREVQILDEMARLLREPKSWCKKWRKRRRWFCFGREAYCLLGALEETTGDIGKHFPLWCRLRSPEALVWTALHSQANKMGAGSIERFNDRHSTTHADILALIAKARASLLRSA